MNLPPVLYRIAAFVAAAGLSVLVAPLTVTAVEQLSLRAVRSELVAQGATWTSVVSDGLQIVLEGQAPNEAERFHAISIAGTVVDASRVIDNMQVPNAEGAEAPEFAVEILRNDSGVSLIGLIPASTDRANLLARLRNATGDEAVSDLLDQADYPASDMWRAALSFALVALEDLPRAKVSVRADRVEVTAIVENNARKQLIESRLAREAPEGLHLMMTITAPRPVVTPFTTRFILDADGARFDACAADTEAAMDRIIAAATQAGLTFKANCELALGVPSTHWGEAVAMAIAAVGELGGGTVTIADADITLQAAEGTDQELYDDVIGRLSNHLPDVFALKAELPVAKSESDALTTEVVATLSPEGDVQLRGRVSDQLMNDTVEIMADARFGKDNVTMRTLVEPEGLPAGWSLRVLAGIEALDALSAGQVSITPDNILVSGRSQDEQASGEISRLLIDRLGQNADFSIDVTYQAPTVVAQETGPAPEDCLAQINALVAETKITFDPSSATLSSTTLPVIDALAAVLRDCPDLPLEIAGYTDSQGRAEMNQRLSQQRADAVVSALRGRRVLTSSFLAYGYGEESPIADNETETGREANRRIEFRLLTPEEIAARKSGETPPPETTATDAGEAPATTDIPEEFSDGPTDEGADLSGDAAASE